MSINKSVLSDKITYFMIYVKKICFKFFQWNSALMGLVLD